MSPEDSNRESSTDDQPTCYECEAPAAVKHEHENGAVSFTRFYCETHAYGLDSDNQTALTDGGESRSDDEPSPATCENCGESYSTETIAGPGEARRSCGCAFEPEFDVPDDTPNAIANAAIRALTASGDVETAAQIREGARERLMADGGIEISRERFECSNCGFEAAEREAFDVSGLAMTCPDCRSVRVEHVFPDEPDLPESFADLASTCENCGEDVDPERLIEGQCPGCHYRPMADGGAEYDQIERGLDALERIADELAFQNAVLTEQARAQHQTAVAGSDYAEPEEKPTSSPTTRSMLTKIRDHEGERERTDRGPLLPDGGEDGQQENLLIVEEEQVGTQNGYPLMQGVRYGKSPVSEKWYKMTRWEDRGGEHLRAISKEEVDQSEVEEAIGR